MTDFTKKIKKMDNTRYLKKISNANLKHNFRPDRKRTLTERQIKRGAVRNALGVYDKSVDAVYGKENQAEGAGEKTIASFGSNKKKLSRNIQNIIYYKNEQRLLKEKRKPYRVAKAADTMQNGEPRAVKVRRSSKKLKSHSGIKSKKVPKPLGLTKRNIKGNVLLARSAFTKVKIITAAATSVVPILICVLIVAMIGAAFSVCPIDAYSSRASDFYEEIGAWDVEYMVKHVEKDEDGDKAVWYEWPYLTKSGVTADRDAMLAYISAKYPFLEEEKSDDAELMLKQLYYAAKEENMHDNIAEYIESHKDELFEGREYGDYVLYMQDPYILYRCYGSPLKGYDWENNISSHLGARLDPVKEKPGFHRGIDIACPVGTEINSIMSAIVTHVDKNGSGERGIYLQTTAHIERGLLHKDIDIVTTYQHLSKTFVEAGQRVNTGDVIALSGNTGKSTGAHLHIEIIKNGNENINPEIVCERNV